MKHLFFLFIYLAYINISFASSESDYKLRFGVIIHNEYGEPIAFEETVKIPLTTNGTNTLFGVLVTSQNEETFRLNSIHIAPDSEKSVLARKVLGNDMLVKKQGAIFARTQQGDIPGDYVLEVYINNKLAHSLVYQLVTDEIAMK